MLVLKFICSDIPEQTLINDTEIGEARQGRNDKNNEDDSEVYITTSNLEMLNFKRIESGPCTVELLIMHNLGQPTLAMHY